MPNDMSHPPHPPLSTAEALAARARRYCDRAMALAAAPDLSVTGAAKALDHLAALQAELVQEHQRQSHPARSELARIDRLFEPHEMALTRARAAVSEALLHARPEAGDLFGRTSHGAPGEPGAAADTHDGTASGGAVHAISACRALVDLDALRPFLDERALRLAIAAHARATGRHDLRGVAYATLPNSAHLPCAIT